MSFPTQIAYEKDQSALPWSETDRVTSAVRLFGPGEFAGYHKYFYTPSSMSHQQILINGNGTNGLQTLQHYLVNNHIPAQTDQPHQNVHVQIVKHEQAQQQRFIINRQYLPQAQQVQVQPNQVQVQEVQPYWLLVEIESNSELNSYALVEAKDVVGHPPLETLSTGKLVVVTINGKQRRATVVMASCDKSFIFAEFNQLNKMAEDNLKLRNEAQIRKRRRISKDVDDDSSLSGWSGVSQNVVPERVMSPSANVVQKKIDRYIPPMMLEQGVQTDSRLTGNMGDSSEKSLDLQRLIELSEQILNEQKVLKNEAKMSRLLVESFSDEFSAMRKSVQSIETKIETLMAERPNFETFDAAGPKKKILNGSGTAPYYIIEQEGHVNENASLSLNGSNLEYTVEEYEAAGDDSVRSTSRMSYQDQASMMSNSSADFTICKKEPFRRSHSSSNFSVHSSSSTPLARASSNSNLIEEWVDAEGDVMIGSNKTTVPVHVLRAIDWKNYKTATRKLLITLFSRETLATKSLTGRPSPAFHDRNKPVKGKLDQNIINDIIQIVTRKCNVQESQVRTAITTKCADENKMLRNRKENEEKDKFKTPTTKQNEDKENIVNN